MRHAWILWMVGVVGCADTADKAENNVVVINNANNGSNNVNNGSNSGANNVATNNLPTGEGGVLTFLDPGFNTPQVAFGPGGRAHMVYTAGLTPGYLVYGTCASGCEAQQNWEFASIFTDDEVDEARMGVDAAGRVHVVFQQEAIDGDPRTFYGRCASGCTDPGAWSTVELTALIGGSRAAYRGAPLVVDPEGGVAMLTSTLTVNAPITLALCGGDCTNPDNWGAGVVRQGGLRTSLAVNASGLHMFLYDGANSIVYQTCSAGCNDAANWQQASLFAHDGGSNISVVAVGDELRVAYNQGRSYSDVQAVADQDFRTLFWTCSSNCLDAASWSGTVLANPKDGESLALAGLGPVSVLAYETDDLKLNVGVCESNCTDAASWSSVTVDSTEAMNASSDPYLMLCGDSRPYFASWYVNDPVIAIDPETGAGMFAHSGSNLRQCALGGQQTSVYGMGRLIFMP